MISNFQKRFASILIRNFDRKTFYPYCYQNRKFRDVRNPNIKIATFKCFSERNANDTTDYKSCKCDLADTNSITTEQQYYGLYIEISYPAFKDLDFPTLWGIESLLVRFRTRHFILFRQFAKES